MRKFLASLGVVCLATAASAQTCDLNTWVQYRVDDGSAESGWKVTGPSGPSDWFNVNLGGLVSGVTAGVIIADLSETAGIAGSMNDLALFTSNANGDPDIGGGRIQGQAGAPVPAGKGFGDTGYCIPVVTLGSDCHVAAGWNLGDSHVWIDSDSNSAAANLSAFTQNGYATASIPWSASDWSLGVGGFPAGSDGTLLINGSSSVKVFQGDTFCVTFTACQSGVASALFLHFGPILFGPLLPIPLTITGNPFTGGPLPNQWTICVTTDCNFPTGQFCFCTIYLDPCMPKPNGKPAAKISTTGCVTVCPSRICQGCFGQKDDGVGDTTIWKVQNPAGLSDWFNVNHGSPKPTSGVSMLTGIEIASNDFCGFGPTWGEVGLYPQLSGSPGAPDINNPFATVANPTMPPGAAEWAYPATFYDIPDFAASTTTTYHAALKWSAGDTCMWVTSDTDGTDSGCAHQIGTPATSFWTLDDYTGGANAFSTANWLMKIDW